jgi:hypothetical protein
MIVSGLLLEGGDVAIADWGSATGQSLSAFEGLHSTPSRRYLAPDPIPEDVLGRSSTQRSAARPGALS